MANSAQQAAPVTQRNGVVTLEPQQNVMKTVNLVIVGQRLALKTDQDPAELERMAQELNDCADLIRKQAPGASAPQIMALTMMQVMERALKAERQDALHCQAMSDYARRLELLLSSLDSAEPQK